MIATTERPVAIEPGLIRRRLDEILNRWATVGFAVGLVRRGRLEYFAGHGVADVASATPITQDTIFRIASISKTFTAIAVMQLWEQGLIDLDVPANQYLRSFRLQPTRAGFRQPTIRHLMTHTAGIPEMVRPSRALGYMFGESYALGERVPKLSEYYGRGIRVTADPGSRFTYTDHSFSTLGQIVEDVSGQPLDRYMKDRIFGPLGMNATSLIRSEGVKSRLATGYTLAANGPKRVTDRQWLTAAASMVYSSPRDMALYLAALMGGGGNEHGTILKPATLATMFEPQYRPDPRVPGIGLAFDRAFIGGHTVIGHEGILPGFNSQIFVAPDDGVGVMAFTNGARLAMLWLPGETAGLLSTALGVPEDAIKTDVPQHPEVWGDICGWYPFKAPLTDMRAHAMMGAGAKVFVRRGELVLQIVSPIPAALRGFVLRPDDRDDPYVFRIDASQFGLPAARVVFGRDLAEKTTVICMDMLPVSLRRERGGGGNRRWWIAGAAVGIELAAAAVAWRSRRRRAKETLRYRPDGTGTKGHAARS